MKFKSLAMEIWVTFTTIILVIILLITSIYYVSFRVLNEKAKMKDLSFVHGIMSNQGANESISFDTMQNLKGSSHFLYSDGTIKPVRTQTGPNPVNDNAGQKNSFVPSSIDKANKDFKGDHYFENRQETEKFLATFAVGHLSGAQFKEKFQGTNYLFVISLTDDGYVISYMPNTYDNTMIYSMIAVCLLFILVSFFVSKIVSKGIAKPLLELEGFTKRIAEKDFSRKIYVKNHDEIGRLADSMNLMQEDLQRAETEERQFLQSISHDLKTPVMVIMSHADAIIDGIYVDSLENTASIIKNEAITLTKKIKELLYYNTLDYMLSDKSKTEQVDIAMICQNIVTRLRPIADTINWSVNVQSFSINANPEKITVAIENVLENAIRYAKGEIRVDAANGEIIIFNDGKKLPDGCNEKVFDHLYKDKTGNFGLGLAITKKITNFYGGEIYAENVPGGVSFHFNFSEKLLG